MPIEGGWVREVFAFEGAVVVRSRTELGNRLTVVDPETNEVAVSRLIEGESGFDWRDPEQDYSLGAGDRSLWIGGGFHSRDLARIDPRTARRQGEPLEVERRLGASRPLVGDAGGLWFVGQRVWGGRATLNRLDPETGAVGLTVDLPGRRDPVAFAVGADSAWVLGFDGSLTRIDLG